MERRGGCKLLDFGVDHWKEEGLLFRLNERSANFFEKTLDGKKLSGIIYFAVTSDEGQQLSGEMAELVEGARLEIV